jgi:hypothetical protein
VLALVRCLTRCPKDERVTRLLVIIFVPLFGWLLYFLIDPKPGRPADPRSPPLVPPAPEQPPTNDDTARVVARDIRNRSK